MGLFYLEDLSVGQRFTSGDYRVDADQIKAFAEQFTNPYSATKAYVLSFSLSLNQELTGSGVRVQVVLPGATRTEIWERAGRDISTIPAEMLMGVDEMVDAALAGFDAGELVTLPALPDIADWEAFTAARLKLAPNLSRNQAAPRYKAPVFV